MGNTISSFFGKNTDTIVPGKNGEEFHYGTIHFTPPSGTTKQRFDLTTIPNSADPQNLLSPIYQSAIHDLELTTFSDYKTFLLLNNPSLKCSTLYDLFYYLTNVLYPTFPALSARTYLIDELAGGYKLHPKTNLIERGNYVGMTFRELFDTTIALSVMLDRINRCVLRTNNANSNNTPSIAILSNNRPEYFMMLFAAACQSFQIAPLDPALGVKGLYHSLQLVNASTIVTTFEELPTILKTIEIVFNPQLLFKEKEQNGNADEHARIVNNDHPEISQNVDIPPKEDESLDNTTTPRQKTNDNLALEPQQQTQQESPFCPIQNIIIIDSILDGRWCNVFDTVSQNTMDTINTSLSKYCKVTNCVGNNRSLLELSDEQHDHRTNINIFSFNELLVQGSVHIDRLFQQQQLQHSTTNIADIDNDDAHLENINVTNTRHQPQHNSSLHPLTGEPNVDLGDIISLDGNDNDTTNTCESLALSNVTDNTTHQDGDAYDDTSPSDAQYFHSTVQDPPTMQQPLTSSQSLMEHYYSCPNNHALNSHHDSSASFPLPPSTTQSMTSYEQKWNNFLLTILDPATPDTQIITMFTSGSTGKPKQIPITHQNIISTISGVMAMLGSTKQLQYTTTFSYLPLSHILEIATDLCSLSTGGQLYFHSGDIKKFSDDLKEAKPKLISAVPRVLQRIEQGTWKQINEQNILTRTMIHTAYNKQLQLYRKKQPLSEFIDRNIFATLRAAIGFENLKHINVGGAAPKPATLEFFQILGGNNLNMRVGYGLSETTGLVTLTTDREKRLNDSNQEEMSGYLPMGCIGNLMPNLQIRLQSLPSMGYYYNPTEQTTLNKNNVTNNQDTASKIPHKIDNDDEKKGDLDNEQSYVDEKQPIDNNNNHNDFQAPLTMYPAGELLVRGSSVITKYEYAAQHDNMNNNDDPNIEAFSYDSNGDIWFHTGDIVRLNPDHTLSMIDRKKNFLKLSQGLYVSVEKLVETYTKCPLIKQIYPHGASDEGYMVAIVVPEVRQLLSYLNKHKLAGTLSPSPPSHLSPDWVEKLNEIINDHRDQIEQYFLEQMKKFDDELSGFERVKKIYLECEYDSEGLCFTLENNCVTPTLKLKYNEIAKRYRAQIEKLYATPFSEKPVNIHSIANKRQSQTMDQNKSQHIQVD